MFLKNTAELNIDDVKTATVQAQALQDTTHVARAVILVQLILDRLWCSARALRLLRAVSGRRR